MEKIVISDARMKQREVAREETKQMSQLTLGLASRGSPQCKEGTKKGLKI